MHVVTFYSYKGGVGRTMALVNVAFELRRRRRRVLILDFDLEAPGISTYEEFSYAAQHEGIVDYVVSYLDRGEAPQVENYIVECPPEQDDIQPIWILPAGRRDNSYSHNLNSINWQSLYGENDGFLMFADLLQQLQQLRKFDYVLIDSRTGHTDVGGICTRQLPDAVIMMFYPNEQNISGLSNIVDEIRNDKSRDEDKIQLHFCAANVPHLDDEEEILSTRLAYAKSNLRYERNLSIIHHYTSLDFLNQAIFVTKRSKTRLADEYRQLTEVIIKGNLEDREGAIAALEDLKSVFRVHRRNQDGANVAFTQAVEQVHKIQQLHPKDGEIAWELACIYGLLGSLDDELDALTSAIENGHNILAAKRNRAQNLLARGDRKKARADLISVLESPQAKPIDISVATKLLRECDKEWIDAIIRSPAIARLNLNERIHIGNNLTVEPKGARFAAKMIFDLLENTSDAISNNVLVLSLIGSGQFKTAMTLSDKTRSYYLASQNIIFVFNYAMAEWGHTQHVPLDLVHRVIDLDAEPDLEPELRGANYHQCISLCYALLGDSGIARQRIQLARDKLGPGSIFSSWRYLTVNQHEMNTDLNAMDQAIRYGRVHPPFLDRAGELISDRA